MHCESWQGYEMSLNTPYGKKIYVYILHIYTLLNIVYIHVINILINFIFFFLFWVMKNVIYD